MPLSSLKSPQEPTEGSAMISLGELFRLEERRQQEERERDRQQREREERAMRARLQAERDRADEQRKALEAQRSQSEREDAEDAARLAGLMLGFIARAKVEAEAKAAEQARTAQHQRQMELERVRIADSSQWLRRAWAATIVAGAMAVAAMLGAYFGAIEPQQEGALAAARADSLAAQDELRSARAQLDQTRSQVTDGAAKLAALQRERDRYKASLEELTVAVEEARRHGGRGQIASTATTSAAPAYQKCEHEGDPMCGLER